jgi:glutamate N-acetyltransferase/amino-acid N-acetyltransferase
MDTNRLEIVLNGVVVCQDGQARGDRMAADLSGRDILVEIGLGAGDASGEIRTTDLSHAYVEENSAYSS